MRETRRDLSRIYTLEAAVVRAPARTDSSARVCVYIYMCVCDPSKFSPEFLFPAYVSRVARR